MSRESSPGCLRQTQCGVLPPRQTDKALLIWQGLSSPSFPPLGRTRELQDISWRLSERGPSPLHLQSPAAGGRGKGQVQGRDVVPKNAEGMLNF